jgi:hypothetical protein
MFVGGALCVMLARDQRNIREDTGNYSVLVYVIPSSRESCLTFQLTLKCAYT